MIHLVRDGRAVSASSMRRLGMGMEEAAALWRTTDQRCRLAATQVSPTRKMVVKYEDLCADVKGSLASIFSFLGLPFSEGDERIHREGQHLIGGNPMRFRTNEVVISRDDRWREELGATDLAVFDRVAGDYNKSWGYF